MDDGWMYAFSSMWYELECLDAMIWGELVKDSSCSLLSPDHNPVRRASVYIRGRPLRKLAYLTADAAGVLLFEHEDPRYVNSAGTEYGFDIWRKYWTEGFVKSPASARSVLEQEAACRVSSMPRQHWETRAKRERREDVLARSHGGRRLILEKSRIIIADPVSSG
jgi:hypothetical protein